MEDPLRVSTLYCGRFNHIKTMILIQDFPAAKLRGEPLISRGPTFTLPVPFLYYKVNCIFLFMNAKNVVIGGIAAGFLLLILMMVSGYLVNMVMPADISQYGGMRAMNDPIMNLFYLYPFVIAFAAAVVFDCVRDSLKGDTTRKGLMFGGLLLTIMTIPSLFVMITSMTWPLDFYVSTGIWEIISFPLMGVMFAKIWKV
jgi:hypothetical protein